MRRGLLASALLLSAVGVWAQTQPNCPAGQLTISPTSLPNGSAGVSYSQTLTTQQISSATYSWSIVSGALPPGLSLNPQSSPMWNAVISGTPSFGVTSFNFTVNVLATFPSGGTLSCSQPYTVAISGSGPAIVPQTLPNGNVNVSYSQQLSTSPSVTNAMYAWSSSGQLPTGLSLNSSGLISGLPTLQGTYSFTVSLVLTFPGGGTSSSSQDYMISILTTGGGFTITTLSLPNGSLTQSYSQQLTTNAQPNTTPIAWSVSSGQFPPGLMLDPKSGVISGAPTTGGVYTFVVMAVEQIDTSPLPTSSVSLTIKITGSTLSIVQIELPVGVQGTLYNVTLTGTGGVPPYQWSLSGTTTLGLTIGQTTGTITGTPMTPGSFTLGVVLTDSVGISVQRGFAFFVATPLKVLTASLPNGSVGVAYSQTLVAGGGQPPYTWSLGAGTLLPPGLQLSPAGVISGTPTSNGSYQFTLQLSDFGSRTASATLTITIGPGLTITTTSLPDGTVGVAYSQTLTATGGAVPITWSITSGTLPDGLKLDPASGIISGTPTTASTLTITVQAADSAGNSVQATFAINIRPSLTITTTSLPDAVTGVSYSQTIATSGGQAPLTFSISQGALPGGLSLNPTTGAIGGTPAVAGAFSFTVSVTDASKLTATAALSIQATNPLTITTGNLTAIVGVAFSVTLAGSGGTSPYAIQISSGTLPAGLRFDPASATISGTPTASGSASIVFTITDSRKQAVSKTILVTVSPPPTVTLGGAPATAPPGTQQPFTVSLGSAYAVDLNGTATLAFASSAGADDQLITFCSGGRTMSFTIPAGATQAVFPCGPNVVIVGTTAGTITLVVSLSAGGVNVTPSPAPSTTIKINPTPPVMTKVTFQQSTGGFTMSVTGFSNTREMVSGLFHFVPASNNTFAQSDITVQLGSAFLTWYQNPASVATGSEFTLTLPFTVQGNAQAVVSYTVTLTNSIGNSTPFPGNP